MSEDIEDPVAWAAAQPADPVRRRVLQALALRAQTAPPGALRDRLIAKLRQRASRPQLVARQREPAVPAHPLADLLARLETDAGPELRQLRVHDRSWRELRVARSIAELQTPAADHLGPLNGQALATRALQQIQALAPDYLHRLLTQMDAIAALESLQLSGEADKPAKTRTKKVAERRR